MEGNDFLYIKQKCFVRPAHILHSFLLLSTQSIPPVQKKKKKEKMLLKFCKGNYNRTSIHVKFLHAHVSV